MGLGWPRIRAIFRPSQGLNNQFLVEFMTWLLRYNMFSRVLLPSPMKKANHEYCWRWGCIYNTKPFTAAVSVVGKKELKKPYRQPRSHLGGQERRIVRRCARGPNLAVFSLGLLGKPIGCFGSLASARWSEPVTGSDCIVSRDLPSLGERGKDQASCAINALWLSVSLHG